MRLTKIDPKKDLNDKAREMYNFHKVAAVLADYGYTCMWLSNDWNGADFIAVHIDGVSDIKVQLKGGISFAQKYRNKGLYICFIDADSGATYLYPHDEVLDKVEPQISDKKWQEQGTYFQTRITSKFRDLLSSYKI